jgi:hypothetical protein
MNAITRTQRRAAPSKAAAPSGGGAPYPTREGRHD